MIPRSATFRANSRAALDNPELVRALGTMKTGFRQKRAAAVDALPEFDALRDRAVAMKNHTLDHLDHYLESFADKVEAAGGTVHWATDAEAARQQVLEICRAHGAHTVTKGKSMIAEEVGLNEALEDAGMRPVETDLGEYIIQLRREPPSHIIAPAIHVSKAQVADAFRAAHGDLDPARELDTPRALLDEARAVLRHDFTAADVGITGANLLIAETGATVIVTNEGNGDLTQLLPRVHIVLASLEKVVPTLDDASLILRLLARSATGQTASSYTSFSLGPRRPEDADGPQAFHVILLDNGRSEMLGNGFREMLRCIRCAACMNHCPVYGAVGGHAYGWVYPGPMGSVLTPALIGIDKAAPLPEASTLCGRCEAVCPMRIPLPGLLRQWRARAHDQRLSPPAMRRGLAAWGWLAARPRLYHPLNRLAAVALGRLGRRRGGFARLPLAGGWTKSRDLPAPEGDTFQARYRRGARRP
ncbi:lactate utilization protein B [Roseospirillum parvum]|uniref:L-lactate dehydrogenase complex protein LldF n=1 Tax=Roseospirillum parvum TaxID=83401 RepID=A0A1G8DPV7_9PROT|nr:lactate utilization protein B [Roseospirillum parvum]SDH59682.1 L-lactate dehydrogenase complex protein LldF [Roseospirillum parvum]